MPAAAGFPPERLTPREVAKIVLRDRRINDQYSNARYLRRLSREGIVTVLAVSSQAHQAYLAEHGIQSEFVFIGHHPTYGRRLDLERDNPSSSSVSTASGGGDESSGASGGRASKLSRSVAVRPRGGTGERRGRSC